MEPKITHLAANAHGGQGRSKGLAYRNGANYWSPVRRGRTKPGPTARNMAECRRQSRQPLRRALSMHFDELVFEIVLTPRGQTSSWWLTQIKAFKATPVAPEAGPKRAAKFKSSVDRPHVIWCVGDHCLGPRRKQQSENAAAGGATSQVSEGFGGIYPTHPTGHPSPPHG